MLSQFRNFVSIILIDTYIPEGVIEYVNSLKLFTLSFDFLNIKSIPGIKTVFDWLDFDQPDAKLRLLEVESGSAFVNTSNLYSVIFIILFVHAV